MRSYGYSTKHINRGKQVVFCISVAIISGGLIVALSNRNYKHTKEIVDKVLSIKILKPVREVFKDFYETVIKGKEILKEDKPKDTQNNDSNNS
jgi:hypothetical protein